MFDMAKEYQGGKCNFEHRKYLAWGRGVGDRAGSGVEPDHAGLMSHRKHNGFYSEEDGELLEGFDIRCNLS